MNETRVIVIRHGETEWNKTGKWQGHEDSPLTDNGLEQAHAAAKQLQRYPVNAIYSSDLGRAMQTARIIATPHNLEVQSDSRIRERRLGIFQGLTLQEMKQRYPVETKRHQSEDSTYSLPGGESKQQQFDRCVCCFNELAENHPQQTIAIVTHGGVVNCLFKYVMGLPLEKPRNYILFNTAINIFSYTDGEWGLHTFGDINHLHQLKTLDEKTD